MRNLILRIRNNDVYIKLIQNKITILRNINNKVNRKVFKKIETFSYKTILVTILSKNKNF